MKDNRNVPTQKKSPALALLWLLMIPGQFIISTLITTLGANLEASMYADRPDDAVGHPVPFLTVIFAGIAAFLVVMAVVVAIMLTIIRMIVISRRSKRIDQMTTGYGPYDRSGPAPEPDTRDREQIYYSPPR